MTAAQQLIFDLPYRVAHGRADFFVADSNRHAVEMIDRWPDWPARIMLLTGPPTSGKTHLASVWQQISGAQFVDDEALSGAALPVFSTPLLVDDLDKKIKTMAAENIFLLFNQVIHSGVFLLLTSSALPADISALADLRSRLCAAPMLTLAPPDEALIGAVMIKMFSDRQLDISEPVISWLLARMERSFAKAHQIVVLLDRASLARQAPITIPLARAVLSPSVLS